MSAKAGVALLSVSVLYHERVPMSCLQHFDALQANNCITEPPVASKLSPDGT